LLPWLRLCFYACNSATFCAKNNTKQTIRKAVKFWLKCYTSVYYKAKYIL
jgi:hypothetical protein